MKKKKDGRDNADWFQILLLDNVKKEEADKDKDGVKEERCKPGQKLLGILLRKASICYIHYFGDSSEYILLLPAA